MRVPVGTILVSALSVLCVSAQAEPPAVDLAPLVEGAQAPGLVAAVLQRGAVLHAEAFGQARLNPESPVTLDTRFEIGSISKPMTAIVALRLAERGKLALDDTLGQWLGDAVPRWKSVTLRQLLTHTSGIPDYESAAGYVVYHRPADLAHVVSIASDAADAFPPGTDFAYSNTGYYLLSVVLERAGEKPLAELLKAELFRPLGMRHSSLGSTGATTCTGYEWVDDAFVARPPIEPSATLGAGGVVTTLADLARWDAALSNRSEKLLSRQSFDLLWTPTRLNDGREVGYALGWIVDRDRRARRVMHTGKTAGFSALYHHYPEHGISVVALANAHGARLSAVARSLSLQFIPALRYASFGVVKDADQERSALHLKALRQAVLGGDDLGLLHDGMRGFATDEVYAPLRASLAGAVRGTKRFDLLDVREVGGDSEGALQHFLYRQASDEGTLYWTLVMRDGRLTALNWEEE